MRSLVLFTLISCAAFAHVGSPDVFYEGAAGPYHVLVAIRPPVVIPGVAEVEVRVPANDVKEVRVVPLRLQGPGAKFAPTPDVAKRSKDDPQFYTGSLWMMGFGSWQVRVQVEGAQGRGETSIPVPALAVRSSTMQTSLGVLLSVLMLVLVAGIVSIVGAGAREAQLEPGVVPDARRRKRAGVIMGVTGVLVVLAVALGDKWWGAEAKSYAENIYKPVRMSARVEGGRLMLRLQDTGIMLRFDRPDDLLLDHGHLMHLYVIADPAMDRVWHLHPEQDAAGEFGIDLPPMPAGKYRLFADIVHASGLGETGTAGVEIPAVAPGRALAGDDSAGAGVAIAQADFNRTVSPLPDGYKMVWARDAAPLKAKRAYLFQFRVEDAAGKPAEGMELYMGMPGHAAFVRDDFQVFAHIHPSGSAPMAALDIAQSQVAGGKDSGGGMSGMQGMHSMHTAALPPEASFPYGFPQPGDYRIFVQVKRAGKVEMGIFDARVE